jgi:hypothetical protein
VSPTGPAPAITTFGLLLMNWGAGWSEFGGREIAPHRSRII